jgi:hypothetical protein
MSMSFAFVKSGILQAATWDYTQYFLSLSLSLSLKVQIKALSLSVSLAYNVGIFEGVSSVWSILISCVSSLSLCTLYIQIAYNTLCIRNIATIHLERVVSLQPITSQTAGGQNKEDGIHTMYLTSWSVESWRSVCISRLYILCMNMSVWKWVA